MPIINLKHKKEIKRTTFQEFYDAAIKAAPIYTFDRAKWLAFYLETRRLAEQYCKSEWKECPDCGRVHFIRADGYSVHPNIATKVQDRKNWSKNVGISTPLGNAEQLPAYSLKASRAQTLRSFINAS